MRKIVSLLFVLVAAYGCRDSATIIDKDPFFKSTVNAERVDSPTVIETSRTFARDHNLDIAVNHFGGGKFSVLMHNSEFNLISMNTIYPNQIEIEALSRRLPTSRQERLAREYRKIVADSLPRTNGKSNHQVDL